MSDAVLVRPASLADLDALTSLFEGYRAFYKQVSISLAFVSSDEGFSQIRIRASSDIAFDACIARLKLGLLELQSF